MLSFGNKNLRESTKLSSSIQTAKFNKEMIKKNVKWKIMHKINQCKPSRICTLCNSERLEIAFADKISSLNSRTKLIGKCRHFAKVHLNHSIFMSVIAYFTIFKFVAFVLVFISYLYFIFLFHCMLYPISFLY